MSLRWSQRSSGWADSTWINPYREKVAKAIQNAIIRQQTSVDVTVPNAALELLKLDWASAGYFFTYDLDGNGSILVSLSWSIEDGR